MLQHCAVQLTHLPASLGDQAFHLLVVNDVAAASPITFRDFVNQRPDLKRPRAVRLDSRRGTHRLVHVGGELFLAGLVECAREHRELYPEPGFARPAATDRDLGRLLRV